MKEKLLLHACCAPCTTAVLRKLRSEELDVKGIFFNPNIHPEDEFEKRIASYRGFAIAEKLDTIIDDRYDIDMFNREVAGKDGDRCFNCYRLRLERTASCAKENKFTLFSTTVLISPYQKHDLVKKAGEEAAKKYGVEFYYLDFRPLYRESVELSKRSGLYRQKYCGCYLSLQEAGAANGKG